MADANVKITAGSVKFEEFSGDDVESYIECLEQHLIAWELDGDDEVTKKKRKAILISSIWGETYRVLKDMCYPDTPASRTYDQLFTHLRSYYAPKKLAVAERYRFHNTKQKPGQSICEFATFLKKIASCCNFGNDLQMNLRDRFICGFQSENLQRKLSSEDLTFQQALDKAVADEAAGRNVRDMTSVGQSQLVHKLLQGF